MSKGHKTSLFSITLRFRYSLAASQSQLRSVHVNLLLSLSLAYASQASAASISKENIALFKHPMQMHARTHTGGSGSKRIRCSRMYTHKPPRFTAHNTHTFKSQGHIRWHRLSNCWVVKSGTGQVDFKKVVWFGHGMPAFIIREVREVDRFCCETKSKKVAHWLSHILSIAYSFKHCVYTFLN